MSWAAQVAASSFRATGEGATLTLQAQSTGAAVRTYLDVKERSTTLRSFRGEQLQEAAVRTLLVPRLLGSVAPSSGEIAVYDGGAAGAVSTVAQEAGFWTVGVGS